MEYVTNYMRPHIDPVAWARRREAQGWDLLSVADHFFTSGRPFPHVWVAAGALAAATTTARITTAFVNNLFRSPVEVAQAALMMQKVSGGRFELGLGAGWSRSEIEGAGMPFLEPGERADAFAESAEIIRTLLHSGECSFRGDHYDIDISDIGPISETPPPLVASVGGQRTVREVTPHCDRVEIKAASAATRGGELDLEVLAQVTDDDLRDLIERVRAVDAEIPIGMFVLCNVGEDELTSGMEKMLRGGLYSRFYGPPTKVAENLAWLEEVGISRCQISPHDDASFDRLAPAIFGDRSGADA